MSNATMPATRQQQNGAVVAAPQFDPRIGGFGQLLKAPNFVASLKQILPRTITPERMIRVALSAMTQQPKLLECTPESVMLSILRAAACGLECDGGPTGQGYLVPFFNGKTRRMECQFIPGYRGLCKMARNSGEVADVWAEVVYEHDQFDYELGLEPTLKHKRNDDVADPGNMKYAYAVARFRDGERKFVVMNAREVQKIKDATKSKDKQGNIFGPWDDHEPEMWKKTAVRRLAKMLPLSTDPDVAAVQAAATNDDAPTIDIPLSMPTMSQHSQLAEHVDEPEPEPQPRGDLTPDEMDDLRKGAEAAGLPGLALQSTLQSMFGKDDLEQLTQAEGKKLRQYIDTKLS